MRIRLVPTKSRVVQALRILRHRYFDNFVFIHINKTGGSSIEEALKLPFSHKTALEKFEEMGRQKWENRYSFAVIRNPWDKAVSHYHFRVQTNQTGLGENTVGFVKWAELTYGFQDTFYYDRPKMFMPQSDWITDLDGQIMVDFVCRFENLNDDFGNVCRKLGKTAKLPHINPSKRGNYRDYYEKETIEIVARWFSKDIDNFGYRF